MPYEIRQSGEQYCVYKKDETEPLHCYKTKKEAVDYMAALYAHENDKDITPQESATVEVEQPAVKPQINKANKALEFSTPLKILELKSESDDWEVSGYVSVFNNVDMGGDIVLPGAFQKSLASGRKVRFLLNHDPKSVLGVPKMLIEDEKGLFGRFKISKTRLGEETHQLLQDGAIDSFSFGYIPTEEHYNDEDVRELKALDIYESSLVAMPMNPAAVVTGFKEYMTLADKTSSITSELSELLNDLRTLTDKKRPLSDKKQQEIKELLEMFSRMDAVRSDFQSLLTASPSSLVSSHQIKYLMAQIKNRHPEIFKE